MLTSRGKPKAVIVSLGDYERIQQAEAQPQVEAWEAWRAANEALSARILAQCQLAAVSDQVFAAKVTTPFAAKVCHSVPSHALPQNQ